MLVGNRHSEGGIKAVNKSNDSQLELEGGEVVITRNAVSDDTKSEFQGQMMTNRQILSKINSDAGGVSFAEGGEIERVKTCGRAYEYGGKTMLDYDIVTSCGCNYDLDSDLISKYDDECQIINEEDAIISSLRSEKESIESQNHVLEDYLGSYNNYNSVKEETIDFLTQISAKRLALPKREAQRAQEAQRIAIANKYERNPEQHLIAIKEFNDSRYDLDADVERLYIGTDYKLSGDAFLFEETKKYSGILESLASSDAVEYGEVYNNRYDIISCFAKFRKLYHDIKAIEKKLEGLNITFSALSLVIAENKRKIADCETQILEAELNKNAKVSLFKQSLMRVLDSPMQCSKPNAEDFSDLSMELKFAEMNMA